MYTVNLNVTLCLKMKSAFKSGGTALYDFEFHYFQQLIALIVFNDSPKQLYDNYEASYQLFRIDEVEL